MIHQSTIQLETRGHGHMHRIDGDVQLMVRESGLQTGLAHLFNVGSTGTVGMIEYEPGLEEDLPAILNQLIPPGKHYGHEQTWQDGNAHSHLQATVMGPGITVPIQNRRLALGTWQQLIHLECDIKPRTRDVIVTLIGE